MLWQLSLPDRYSTLTERELHAAIDARRAELGDDLLILGHHYQQDDVIGHADLRGDSLKLSQMAASESAKRGTKYIVFCGVHFMAETADMLTDDSVSVILPDLSAGCSMADMADYDDVVDAWDTINNHIAPGSPGVCSSGGPSRVIPITYVNSTAAIKAFVGEHGGACCTSSNAEQIFDWALAGGTQPISDDETIRILFLPDQHLGRNTASKRGFLTENDEREGLGISQCAVWNPRLDNGGLSDDQIRGSDILLWAGHCSVHKLFRPEHVEQVQVEYADQGGVTVVVHPECDQEVVSRADLDGSTEFIIRQIESAVPGTNWAIGTEVHLVNRLAKEAAKRGVTVRMLSDCQCLCTTMYRIDPQHLLWVLDNLVERKVVNQVSVPLQIRQSALLALDRMLLHATPLASSHSPVCVD